MKVPEGYVETAPGVFCHRSRIPREVGPAKSEPDARGSLVRDGKASQASEGGSERRDGGRVRVRVRDEQGSGRACVRILMVVQTRRLMDSHDNLRSSLKPLVDAIAERLGVPDNDPRLVWEYGQVQTSRSGVLVRIVIEEPK